MRSVGLVFVFGDTLLTWADYVSMIEDQDKYDKWSNNNFRGENRVFVFLEMWVPAANKAMKPE